MSIKHRVGAVAALVTELCGRLIAVQAEVLTVDESGKSDPAAASKVMLKHMTWGKTLARKTAVRYGDEQAAIILLAAVGHVTSRMASALEIPALNDDREYEAVESLIDQWLEFIEEEEGE